MLILQELKSPRLVKEMIRAKTEIREQIARLSLQLKQLGEESGEEDGEEESLLWCANCSRAQKGPRPPLEVVAKRCDALSWDDYFMSVAFLSSMRSKDPSTQVGACIVSPDKRIVGIGYNGFPRGCSDDELPWAREAVSELDTKYPYVCHAEMNAILNKNSADVKGCTIYVGLFPCNECAKMIIQSGIAEVVYLSDKYKNSNSMRASRKMLTMSRVLLRQHIPIRNSVTVDFSAMSPTPSTV